MRTWTRVRVPETLCRRCGAELRQGDPVQEIQLPDLKRPLMRCVRCADGAPPEDLPELPPAAVPLMTPIAKHGSHGMSGLGSLAVDFKRKQAGDAA